ncbi:MAG: ATP-grasp domain-containing protein, partial [Burkholderiaceae bacterium]
MNIHEHQAKEILREFGAPVSKGVVVFSLDEIDTKIKDLKVGEYVLKAQIHAGGRGKGGGVKLVKDLNELKEKAKVMLGMNLITHQTGPQGKEVKRLYIEEASDISKEFYLSCLIDRQSSKIAFISSTEGGMDIEKVAAETPEKIITTKLELKNDIEQSEVEKVIRPFNFNDKQKVSAEKLIRALYKILIQKDASLIEINPLIITKDERVV